jgi:hypothetical protein
MSPRRFAILTILILCFALSACASFRKAKPKPVPVGPRLIGSISLVNTEAGFVLIDAFEMPQPGSTLKAQSKEGQPTAVLKTCPQQRPPFATADISSGLPQAGDRVFTVPEPVKAH